MWCANPTHDYFSMAREVMEPVQDMEVRIHATVEWVTLMTPDMVDTEAILDTVMDLESMGIHTDSNKEADHLDTCRTRSRPTSHRHAQLMSISQQINPTDRLLLYEFITNRFVISKRNFILFCPKSALFSTFHFI